MENKKVLLVHGFTGAPNSGWLPWIMSELKTRNIYAGSLIMPSPDEPVVSEWVHELSRSIKMVSKGGQEVYLIGHSLGVAAILNYLQSGDVEKIKGAVLVSGRCQKSTNPLTAPFYESFDFEKIKSQSSQFSIIHGDKDTVVDVENAYMLGDNLNTTPIIIKDAGHFTTSEGWREHQKVLELLLEMINK
jgi:predicted alpha/beta hydrolase family esterase